jgi:T-complex protein 1 subunit delta
MSEGAAFKANPRELGGKMDSEKSKDIRSTNIVAAKAVADVVRTSLGPRGMDKMI